MKRPTRIYLFLFIGVLLLTALSQTLPWQGAAEDSLPPSSELGRLPEYALWSLLRMAAAYVLALLFSLPFGYYAATKPRIGKILIPLLDILQSVPVLGFFPVAITIFVALGGGGRLGVEMAAVFLIFTSQAWNMAYGVYESASSVPRDSVEAIRSFGLSRAQAYRRLYFPASIPKLVYNSMLSWAGGWYFLIACEIISVGPVEYSLPGLGAFLLVTVERGYYIGTFIGLGVQVGIIVIMDRLLWKPLLDWSTRFRYEISASSLVRPYASIAREKPGRLRREMRIFIRKRLRMAARTASSLLWEGSERLSSLSRPARPLGNVLWRGFGWLLLILIGAGVLCTAWKVSEALLQPWPAEAWCLPEAIALSTGRMFLAYVIALAWTVPLAVWAGGSPSIGRVVRPLAQIGASIPATALFPVIVVFVVQVFGGMNLASVLLILTGMQWYILFNIMAGIASIPQDLKEAVQSLSLSRWQTFKRLTLPAMFPALITGSVTGWGGGWNALILSEYVRYGGETYWVPGIGSMLDRATFEMGNITLMILSLTLMVGVILLINRLVWRRMYDFAMDRCRLDI